MRSKLLNFIGLARRAGKLKIGADPVCDSVRLGKSRVIIMAQDISENTRKHVEKIAGKYEVKVFTIIYSKNDIYTAIGKYAAVISVEDKGFADKIEEMIKTEENYLNMYSDI